MSSHLTEQKIVEARQSTKDWIARAANLYAVELPEIEVRFDLRGKTSGMFYYRDGQYAIRYNSAIFSRYFEESLQQTVPHEVAHYVVHRIYGRRVKPHGVEWKQVMRDFGVPPDVTSKLNVSDLSTRQLRRFPYRCGCGEHDLSSIRHNRIAQGTRQYGCPKCQQILVAHKQL